MISNVFRCFPMFSAVFRLFLECFPTMFSDCWNPLQVELTYLWWVLSCLQDDIRRFPDVFWLFSDDVFRLLKSPSSWTKLLWWVLSCSQDDISDDFRCFPMFSAVFRCFLTVFRLFSNCFPTMFSDCWIPLQAELNYLWWVLSCSLDDIRWF